MISSLLHYCLTQTTSSCTAGSALSDKSNFGLNRQEVSYTSATAMRDVVVGNQEWSPPCTHTAQEWSLPLHTAQCCVGARKCNRSDETIHKQSATHCPSVTPRWMRPAILSAWTISAYFLTTQTRNRTRTMLFLKASLIQTRLFRDILQIFITFTEDSALESSLSQWQILWASYCREIWVHTLSGLDKVAYGKWHDIEMLGIASITLQWFSQILPWICQIAKNNITSCAKELVNNLSNVFRWKFARFNWEK